MSFLDFSGSKLESILGAVFPISNGHNRKLPLKNQRAQTKHIKLDIFKKNLCKQLSRKQFIFHLHLF
jgi:hypothetical protein